MNAMKRLPWWLLASSVGGVNRGRILEELFRTPHNAHELSKVLGLDYKTIRHHLDVLEKIILSKNETYPITGLYKLDRTNKELDLRWMTAQQVGWAHCKSIS